MVYVTDSNESSSYIRIKFITPIEKDPNRKTTIKIFAGLKINTLGAPSENEAVNIMLFLDKIIKDYENTLFISRSSNYVTIENIIKELDDNSIQSTKYLWCRLIDENWNPNILHIQ